MYACMYIYIYVHMYICTRWKEKQRERERDCTMINSWGFGLLDFTWLDEVQVTLSTLRRHVCGPSIASAPCIKAPVGLTETPRCGLPTLRGGADRLSQVSRQAEGAMGGFFFVDKLRASDHHGQSSETMDGANRIQVKSLVITYVQWRTSTQNINLKKWVDLKISETDLNMI